MNPTIRDWSDTIALSLTPIMQSVPRILGFLAILVIGWIVASLVASAIAALLRRVRFNDLSRRSGFSDFVDNMGVKTDAAGFVAAVVKWFVRLIVLVVAFDALGLPAVSDVLRQLLLWLPNLVVALFVLVIGGLLATGAGNLVRGAATQAGLERPDMLATVARGAIWVFAIVVAVNQLGIATTLINTLFMGLVAAAALAVGLAFGLGGRDEAASMVREWREKARDAAPKIARAGTALREETERTAREGREQLSRGGRNRDGNSTPARRPAE